MGLLVLLTLGTWVVLAVAGLSVRAAEPAQRPLPSYGEWVAACRRLPTNRELGDRIAPKDKLPLRTFGEFSAALEPFLALCRTGALAQAGAWLDAAPSGATFFNLDRGYFDNAGTPFQPFAERAQVPAGTRLFLHGDLHGDIHALIAYLESLNRDGCLDGFRVSRPEVRLVFMGDYTDRGKHGIEVLYTLLRLKLANPAQVLLVRGNHEDVSLVARYGFLAEASQKYGRDLEVRRLVRLYDFLPAVLYVASGTNVVECNHGGLEPGYDPRPLLSAPQGVAFHLLGRIEQKRWLALNAPWVGSLPAATRQALEGSLVDFEPRSPTTPTVLGFMWNDFTVTLGEPQFAIDPGRAFVYGDESTRRVFEAGSRPGARIRALFRAHQHSSELNPMMRRLMVSRGIFRHWQSTDHTTPGDPTPEVLQGWVETREERTIPEASVWTFNVSPDSVYGIGCGFTFDTAGELVTAGRWEDWRLKVRNLAVPGIGR